MVLSMCTAKYRNEVTFNDISPHNIHTPNFVLPGRLRLSLINFDVICVLLNRCFMRLIRFRSVYISIPYFPLLVVKCWILMHVYRCTPLRIQRPHTTFLAVHRWVSHHDIAWEYKPMFLSMSQILRFLVIIPIDRLLF